MQNQQPQVQKIQHKSYDEEILVVKRNLLFAQTPAWQGINSDMQQIMEIITTSSHFMPRSHAETDMSFKQIIPYMLFIFKNKLFVMQRKSSASEQRLASKFSLGIGGHVRQEDITNANIIDWANREFEEEVTYQGSKTIQAVGILNDDSNDVGKVHLGLILIVHADSEKITINDEHKSGILLTRDECKALAPQMETWSQMCFNFLIDQKIL